MLSILKKSGNILCIAMLAIFTLSAIWMIVSVADVSLHNPELTSWKYNAFVVAENYTQYAID